MIQRRTVLVLGAGASMPYGFPSGAHLRDLILQQLGLRAGVALDPLGKLLEEVGFQKPLIEGFRKSLAVADPPSVDIFLETRPDLKAIGKSAIAAVLIPFECEKALFTPWVSTAEVHARMKHRWYDYFANTLRMTFETWGLQRLTILTYNYDRSLEHYLWMKLANSTNEDERQCWKKFNEIPIIHLHGELGSFEPLDAKAMPFGAAVNADTVKRAAADIRIIHEVETDERFENAQAALDQAEVVCFLGFGFAAENMHRLKWDERIDETKPKTIAGTVFGLTLAEQKRLHLARYFNVAEGAPPDWDILQFLRQTNVLG